MSEMKSENFRAEDQVNVSASDNSDNTPLRYAGQMRYAEMARFLLNNGARAGLDVEAPEDKAEAPAPSTGNAQIAELLRDFHISPATENTEIPGLLDDFTTPPVSVQQTVSTPPPAPVQHLISAPPPVASVFGNAQASPVDESLGSDASDDDIPTLESNASDEETPGFPPSDKSSNAAPAA